MRFVASLAVTLLAGLSAARGASSVDMIEHIFGASNVNGVIGNGRMTVGISSIGDGTVLSWPSPSYCDQLLHLGRNDLDVRDSRNLAAADSMGSFIGVRVTSDRGTVLAFPRAPGWHVAQSFPDPRAARMRTVFSHPEMDFTVTLDDHVALAADVWHRRVTVSPVVGATLRDVVVLGYWNLAPTLSRVPQLPLADWTMDAYNDYAAVYGAAARALVHFRPAGRGDIDSVAGLLTRPVIDYGAVGAALADGPVDGAKAQALFDALSSDPSEGVYLAIESDGEPIGHQVGYDDTPTCALVDRLADNILDLPTTFPGFVLPLDPALVNVLRCDLDAADLAAENGWNEPPAGAFEDMLDGELTGSFASAGQVDAALAVRARSQGDGFGVSFRLGAGATFAGALTAASDTSQDVLTLPAQVHLPRDPAVAAVATRALVNVLLAQDRQSHAIVASVSRQAPYALDWPRDGAFFTAALDVAGLTERSTARVPWLLARQRLAAVAPEPFINSTPPPDPDTGDTSTYPAGAWEMNYYADGMVGGNIRWEIDNTGLVVWSLVDHARYLPPSERTPYEAQIFPAVTRAVDLLARWRDPTTGLQAPASEDDNAVHTQTLHGAITTWAALDAAVSLALARPELDLTVRAAVWSARRDELRDAILEHLVDPATHRFKEGLDEASNPGNAAGGPSAWALWPARFLRPEVPAEALIRDATERWLIELAEHRLDPANGGSAYLAKLLLAVALSTEDSARKATTRALLERLALTTASSDTLVFGEVFVGTDSDGDGRADAFSARVSNPHVWAGTLVYLAAMALDAPERFDAPLAAPATPTTPNDGGCTSGAGHALALIVALLALVARRHA